MKKLTRLFPALAVMPLVLAGCAVAPETQPGGSETAVQSEGAEPTTAATEQAEGTVDCTYVPSGEPARPVDPPEESGVLATGEVTFTVETNEGEVRITMDREKAPCTVNSFEALAIQGYFDQTSCHRLVDSGIFVLQCGDPTGTGRGGPGYQFADETDPSDTFPAGTVAMANAGPDTNGSQFFLVYQDTPLPPQYTVFGTMDPDSTGVVARIAVEGQDGTSPGGGGKPNNLAEIIQVTAG